MRDHVAKELTIKVAVPRVVCDECGATQELAPATLLLQPDGTYRAAADPAAWRDATWNDIDLPGGRELTLCGRCTAAAILAKRIVAQQAAQAQIVAPANGERSAVPPSGTADTPATDAGADANAP